MKELIISFGLCLLISLVIGQGKFDGGIGSGNASAILENASLPIELLSFDARFLDKKNVIIEWTTNFEFNNDFYTIEKSSDAINWNTVGHQKSIGNRNEITDYHMIDHLFYNGIVYYRLIQTDHDGSYTISKIITLRKDYNTINIYPNPSTGHFNIQSPIGIYKDGLSVFDIFGKLIIYKEENVSQLDLSNFSKGVYLVKIANVTLRIFKI